MVKLRIAHNEIGLNAGYWWRPASFVWVVEMAIVIAAIHLIDLRSSHCQDEVGKYDQKNRSQTISRDMPFFSPQTYASGSRNTSVLLQVSESVNDLGGVRLKHRSYNNGLVGPIIRVKPGSTLRIRLENHLRSAAQGHDTINGPHGFNTTNLHTHGLHVSPLSPADDVFLKIKPGESFNYQFEIPSDHPAGTFWYHAHKHGSTALQLASGMAGALIVEGGMDDHPKIRAAKEKILVLQQFVYRQVPGDDAIVHPEDVYEELEPRRTAVNGQITPTVTMRPGEVQRWRLVHAGVSGPMEIKMDGITFYEIAADGLAFGAVVPRQKIELQPGQRSDILVKAPNDKDSYVMTSENSRRRRSARQKEIPVSDILKLVVQGKPLDMELPTSQELKQYAPFTDDDVPTEFAERREIKMRGPPDYHIGTQKFDPEFVEIKPQVGTAEEWTIVGDLGGHPFHIHVNPFAVKVPEGDPNPNKWIWRDTLFVEDRQQVAIRMRFKRFTGKTVIHCHMLDHEDEGMMQAIEIKGGETILTTGSKQASRFQQTLAKELSVTSDDKPLLLIFHQGVECIHCAEQLNLLAENAKQFEKLGLRVIPICQFIKDPENEIYTALKPLVPREDPELKLFREFNCVSTKGIPQHGIFLLTKDRKLLWKSITESAETDIDRILSQCRNRLNRSR